MEGDSVRAEIERVLASRHFAQSERMKRFLAFAVERELAGDREALKEYTIGVEVFDRSDDYDPRIDSIVRVEARRLRKKLRAYYENEGRECTLRIDLPEGSYVPRFLSPGGEEPPVEGESRPKPLTVAVLPFTVAPPEERGDLFAGGLTEDLTNALSQSTQIRVLALSTVLQFKGQAAAAGKLAAGKMVQGSVRKLGPRLRVVVQLVSPSDGISEWSESYDRELGDLFAVQAELAETISRPLLAKLTGTEPPEPRPVGHIVPGEAYQALIEGRHFAASMNTPALLRSIELFQQALQIDPDFAAAHAALAGAILQLSLFGEASPSMVVQDATLAVRKALHLAPELPSAHLWRGFLNAACRWSWDEAEIDFQRVLELNPSFVLGRCYYAGLVLLPLERFDEATALLDEADSLGPASFLVATLRGMSRHFQGDFSAAGAYYRTALELNPEFPGACRLLAFCQVHGGDAEGALETLQRIHDAGGDPRATAAQAYVLGCAGHIDKARDRAEELERRSRERYVAAYDKMLASLGYGDIMAAASQLVLAAAEHEPWLVMLRIDPIYKPLWGSRQYAEVVSRIFAEER